MISDCTILPALSGLKKSIPLRKLSANVARLQNELAQVINPLAVVANNAQLFVALDAPRNEVVDCPWLTATVDGELVAIQVPWGIARRIAGEAVEGAGGEDIALLLEEALATWLDEIESSLGMTIRLLKVCKTTPDLLNKLAVCSTLNLQGKDATGSLAQMRQAMRLSPEAAKAISTAIRSRRVQRADLPGLFLVLALERDAVVLSVADYMRLGPGDAIEIFEQEQSGRVVLENQMIAAAKITDAGLELTGRFSPIPPEYKNGDVSVTEPNTSPAPDSSRVEPQLEDIDVRLSFRVGETLVPLKTLRGMAPGTIIEMTDPANATVDIVANGRVVGTGELINVAGRRAVQIRSLFTGN